MGRYIIRRLLIAGILVIGVATLIFSLLQSLPGDPVRVFLGEFATEEQVIGMRHEMGLDRPLLVQYLDWIAGVPRGDLGNSLELNLPVRQLIMERLPRTFELAAVSIVLAVLVGIPIGIASALRRGQISDVGLTVSTLVTLSIPSYVSGTLLVLLFAVRLKWLPSSGYVSFLEDPVGHLQLLLLPAVTLASHLAASIARMTRSSILEVIGHDYVRTARAKGLHERKVLSAHVLRNSLIPVTTIVGLQAGNLLGGAVIVETIFAWPGLSSLLFRGIQVHDFPVVQGSVLVITMLFILVTLIVDILNGVIDPRVSYGAKE